MDTVVSDLWTILLDCTAGGIIKHKECANDGFNSHDLNLDHLMGTALL